MTSYKLHRINSFTTTALTGNSTVCITNADSLTVEQMKAIAREMSVPETSFVLKAGDKDALFRLHFYTPNGFSVPLCGHGTIGALRSLVAEGFKQTNFNIETLSGLVPVEIDYTNNEPKFTLVVAKYKLELGPVYVVEDLTSNVGINFDLVDHDKPVMWDKVYNYVFLVAKSVNSLHQIKPDMVAMAKFCAKDKFDICIIAKGQDNIIHSRCFAPICGIDEDPATGSLACGLYFYGVKQGLITTNKITIKQGEAIGRLSQLYVEKFGDDAVRVSGYAYHLYQTQLLL